jgi:uncharacterized membrane protein (UPF0127 family)
MIRTLLTASVVFILSVAVVSCGGEKLKVNDNIKTASDDEIYKFRKDGELTFVSAAGEYITTIDIEIADTQEKRVRGLMFRKKMAENQGMLFVFPREEYQSFWMKNTVIPLDMIFVNKKREIVNIQKNTTPYSEQTYPSSKPAIYVVEVNAGFTDKYGIKPGDKITWRIFR